MTDSMNFGPDWIRNLSSEGSTGGGTSGGTRYQLADYRYGREEMLALFDKNIRPPASLTNFKSLYSEVTLPPLALVPTTDEERGGWPGRPATMSGPPRGRGGSLERGGRGTRGRGGYQSYGRPLGYEGGWGNGEQADWSPRKEYNARTTSMDNWRRSRNSEEDDGWRNVNAGGRGMHEKWGRSTSWRGDSEAGGEDRTGAGPPERGSRPSWHDTSRGPPSRRSWDNEDHLPEWANENPSEGGGTFDERGAFHGSDDELDGKAFKREGLQKSTSQQHITNKAHPPLPSSKSTMSLVKPETNVIKKEIPKQEENVEVGSTENGTVTEKERKISAPNIPKKVEKVIAEHTERAKSEGPPKTNEKQQIHCNGPIPTDHRVEDNDFERLQEDLVLKLMVDEEPPKQIPNHSNFDMSGLQPPPNLAAPLHDKWFYQDPQGHMQGPFTNLEMAEWYKAGYFSHQLKVRRQCDERFFLLGELINMCGGTNPFQTNVRFPILKNDITKMPDPDIMQFQYLSQMAAYKQAQARIMAEPWSALTLQQQELAAQRLIMQQQQQVPQDLQYMQQPPSNPLMHMINQMQQANKLPGPGMIDKQPQNMPGGPLDPHLHMHMGNLLSLQNRLPGGGLPNHHLPTSMSGGGMPPDTLSTSMPSLQSSGMVGAGGGIPMPGGMQNSMGGGIIRPGSVEHGGSSQDNDPISSLLKQLQQQKQQSQQMDSLWQQNQFGVPTPAPPQQWQSQPSQPEVPLSMWDIQQNNSPPVTVQSENNQQQPQQVMEKTQQQKAEKDQQKLKEDAKDLKKKKEQEEKQLKKEAEEKRKQEQRKLEVEKKAAEEKRRKDEEKIKKELEKAKKEAEEKRLRELEEKRRLKEQRKAEDEERKKSEETKKFEEEEKRRREKEERDAEERQRAEEKRQEQIRQAKAAPWSQANSALGMSLAEIQKAEKEKRAQEAALHVQRAQIEKEMQQQQEKPSGIQLSWAKKPVEPRKVKSLAEIQAEEQERLAKEAAEARLRKEKEAREVPQVQNTGSIWSGQNLTWANTSSQNSQWSSSTNVAGGFWDEGSHYRPQQKPSSVSKSNSTTTINASITKHHQQQQNQQKQQAKKPKKEEPPAAKTNHNNNNNGPSADEFTNWCYKTLSNISHNVDVPTFVTFLRDIESAFDVREYCKEYLGESTATQQFANQFLEKRRSFKPKNNAHKDDMCSPAPAITPASLQHSTEFQEVKGKNKKNKKSKMLKVDSRILGFNVTSAPDRINVGDRDYGDNS